MTDAQLLDKVAELRQQGRSPKDIAHCLGVRTAAVAPIIRDIARRRDADASEPELVGCWVSPGWSNGLRVDGEPDWPGLGDDRPDRSGIAMVLVARRRRYAKVTVCGYLVDTWCLGVKDAFGPRVMDEAGLARDVATYFEVFEADPLAAPVELAQQLVWGAVGHARALGFAPHPDFAAAADHLGEPIESCDITFGQHGRPCYVEGPHDNAARVLRTLERTAGAGNFGFTVALA